MNAKARVILPVALALAALAGGWWWLHRPAPDGVLTVHGNIDFRQASIAFNGAERIAEVLVEEGEQVRRGRILARMDTSRLAPRVAEAEAAVAAQAAAVARLRHGSRPEEIAQQRATLASAEADAEYAALQYRRQQTLGPRAAASQQEIDLAKSATDMARARVAMQRNALQLALLGPRAEDIAQAEAQLQAEQARLALIRQQLADAELRAPFDALVQSRLLEPGEMAASGRPVVALASLGTKWVRAYLPEPDLGRARPGASALIAVDSLPNEPLTGWVGFISPVAEFTPKTVQTEDLRASLVYEIRVFVADPRNVLRLGMPATVRIPDASPAPR